ncbi:hypothetical protein HK407_10g15580 [Ordospora pajunii]|uniref:uncharacterized protein n=1 Tax=Ordospora pajunii TaxID=3039483 RepID=UPI0029528065|nr:uncharacterized protein HK407_10g15580 [Ordospora pajunii]KAH9410792.1 hypothetical protein HK407_10g15580 [Ordospora pajunii]
MRMLFHPTTLKLLHEWKESADLNVRLELLVLLVDCKRKIDYKALDEILYRYKKNKPGKKDRMRYLRAMIDMNFAKKAVEGSDEYVYAANDVSGIPKGIFSLVKRIRNSELGKGRSKKQCLDRSMSDSSMLKFVSVQSRKAPERPAIGMFYPVCFDESVAIATPTCPFGCSIRIRKDVQNSRRLTFIKFSDQPKPPVHRVLNEKLPVRNSTLKLPHVLDYEYESDWEDVDEAEDIESSDGEEVESESSDEWVERDMENMEPVRSNKKPSIMFPNCKYEVFELFPSAWLALPVLDREEFPEDLAIELKKGLLVNSDTQTFLRRFSSMYVISPSCVARKAKEIERNEMCLLQ